MYRFTQPNVWTCLPTSLAMIVEESVENVLDKIGHDGSMIEWPELPEPYCRRGFCINEIIAAALEYQVALVEISQSCLFHPTGNEDDAKPYSVKDPNWEENLLEQYEAILLGEGHSGGSHAVAWNPGRKLIYDPNGSRYNLGLFRRELVYIAVRFGQKDRGKIRQEEQQRQGGLPSGSLVCVNGVVQIARGEIPTK